MNDTLLKKHCKLNNEYCILMNRQDSYLGTFNFILPDCCNYPCNEICINDIKIVYDVLGLNISKIAVNIDGNIILLCSFPNKYNIYNHYIGYINSTNSTCKYKIIDINNIIPYIKNAQIFITGYADCNPFIAEAIYSGPLNNSSDNILINTATVIQNNQTELNSPMVTTNIITINSLNHFDMIDYSGVICCEYNDKISVDFSYCINLECLTPIITCYDGSGIISASLYGYLDSKVSISSIL